MKKEKSKSEGNKLLAVVGFKGFDKQFQCRGFQYEVGKEYTEKGDLKVCRNGLHFCENPLSILNYYPLGSEFAEVEARGDIKTEGDKSVTNRLYIKTKLTLPMFIKSSIDFIWKKASESGSSNAHSATSGDDANSATSGYGANSATSGDRANSATSGYGANSATSGYGANSATSGNDAIACAVGRKAAAKGSLGCWIVLAEWKEGKSFTDAKPIDVKAAKVDGENIKANTFYRLKSGNFVEVME